MKKIKLSILFITLIIGLNSCSSFSPKLFIHNTGEYEGIEIIYSNLPKKEYKEIIYIESISIITPKKAFDKMIEKAKENKADAIIISNHGLGNYTGIGIKYL
jgi:hypothetical protein